MATEVIMPRVDMDMTVGKVGRWFLDEGASVQKGQPLFEIETDKAAMEIDAPSSGILRAVSAKAGDELPVGHVIAWIYGKDESYDPGAASPAAPAVSRPPAKAQAPAAAMQAVEAPGGSGVRATPLARKKAREGGIDIATVKGAGPHGRIDARDVEAMLAAASQSAAVLPRAERGSGAGGMAAPDVPLVDFAKYGPIESAPLSRIQRISGPRLHASWVNIPHVTHCDEADVTELDAFRKRLDDKAKADKAGPYRVSLLPLLMKAAAATLKAFPTFNAALAPDKDALILRRYWHIGVAVDTPDGLVVAVIRDVDRKGVVELARELGALSAKAREGKLTLSEMQGATFTISSLGGVGGTAFTPIVNAPEVAILGVVRAKMAAVWDGRAFQPRLMLPLCLSYDHRVVDGAGAARFMRHLCGAIEDLRRVLL
jgi:pyruvate dehydrogenase E2 component (dihydrolipoamide acetyltransferase)